MKARMQPDHARRSSTAKDKHQYQHQAHGHDHEHEHDQKHDHAHAPKDFGRAFLIGVVLNTAFVIIEATYGILGNSLALLADAGHNLSDVLGLLLAWGASVLVKKAPSKRFTYGLRSTSILAALLNASLLLVVTGGIAWEAITRFRQPEPVEGITVIVVASVGVVINLVTALMFMSGRKNDLNVRAAFLHMAGDAAISLGVVIAGFGLLATGWQWLDPVISLVIAALVVVGTWGLFKESVKLALHAVPDGIDIEKVRHYLASVDGVSQVHDLHIWGMSTTDVALTAHLVFPGGYPGDAIRSEMAAQLQKRFQIAHATIQIELNDCPQPCALTPDHVV